MSDEAKTTGAVPEGRARLLFPWPFEITFALAADAAKGFTRLWLSVLALGAAAGGVHALPPALRELDAYIGHTNWTGIGGVGTAALGAILFKEEITGARVVSFASITGGAFLLRLTAV